MIPSWETLAHTLASRLMHHAYCGNGHEKLDPLNCPFCADIAAYRLYLEKCRVTHRIPSEVPRPTGRAIPIYELMKGRALE